MRKEIGCWLATPDIVFIELAADLGYGTIVFDAEHGVFDLKDLDRLIPFARLLGLDVYVKVEGPRGEPVQQALDFGASGVVIPHVAGAGHARSVCAAAKYPPLGTRSYAGSRPVRYGAPSASYFQDDNARTRCFLMIETAESLAEIEQILRLPMVDGVFVGPSDLSLTRGRGKYGFTEEDRADIGKIASACRSAGKPWMMPAWRADEQRFAAGLGAEVSIIAEQQSAMAMGLKAVRDRMS